MYVICPVAGGKHESRLFFNIDKNNLYLVIFWTNYIRLFVRYPNNEPCKSCILFLKTVIFNFLLGFLWPD